MTKDDLVGLLKKGSDILKQNKSAVTNEVLDQITQTITTLRTHPTMLAAVCALMEKDTNYALSMLNAADEFVSMERKILADGTTEKLTAILDNLQNRTVILTMLAPFV